MSDIRDAAKGEMSGEFAEQLIANLAALVRRMSYQIHRDGTNPRLVQQARDFLKSNGLGGQVLREMGVPADIRVSAKEEK